MLDSKVVVKFELKAGTDPSALSKEIQKIAKKHKVNAHILGLDASGKWKKVGKDLQILMLLGDTTDIKVPGYAPRDFTQEGLGEALDLDRSIVSRHLSELKARKLVRVKTMSIMGEARKRKVYFLTEHGKSLLTQIAKKK